MTEFFALSENIIKGKKRMTIVIIGIVCGNAAFSALRFINPPA